MKNKKLKEVLTKGEAFEAMESVDKSIPTSDQIWESNANVANDESEQEIEQFLNPEDFTPEPIPEYMKQVNKISELLK